MEAPGRPVRSKVWNYFKRLDGKAECLDCSLVIPCKDGNTTSARKHLKLKHPHAFDEMLDQPQMTNEIERALTEGVEQFWASKEFSDVTVFCGDGNAVRSHRIVLSALSPVFRTALRAFDSEEIDAALIIPDVSSVSLERFLYSVCSGSDDEAEIDEELLFLDITDLASAYVAPKVEEKTPVAEVVPRKKRSLVWNYFKQINREQAECMMCNSVCRTDVGSTSGLARHLRISHPKQFAEFCSENAQKRSTKMRLKLNHILPRSSPGTRAKSSFIWRCFGLVEGHDNKRKCKLCDQEIVSYSGSTSAMWRHLRRAHNEQFKEWQKWTEIRALTESMNDEKHEIWQHFENLGNSSYGCRICGLELESSAENVCSNLEGTFANRARRCLCVLLGIQTSKACKSRSSCQNWIQRRLEVF